jgi:excisionase family DNA binding protein
MAKRKRRPQATRSKRLITTLKVWEAAKLANVGDAAIYRGIAEGKIPHIKFGRNILLPRSAFLRWLDSCGNTVQPNRAA